MGGQAGREVKGQRDRDIFGVSARHGGLTLDGREEDRWMGGRGKRA